MEKRRIGQRIRGAEGAAANGCARRHGTGDGRIRSGRPGQRISGTWLLCILACILTTILYSACGSSSGADGGIFAATDSKGSAQEAGVNGAGGGMAAWEIAMYVISAVVVLAAVAGEVVFVRNYGKKKKG